MAKNALARIPPSSQRIDLPDGATAELKGDGALEIADDRGRLLVRYANGNAEICASAGDLRLVATGRVVVESGLDVEIGAARDIVHRARRSVDITADRATIDTARLDVHSKAARAIFGGVELVAKNMTSTAERVAVTATNLERTCDRIAERSREAIREVTELAEEHLGRARIRVREALSIHAHETSIVSTEDSAIDGKRVLLG